MKKASLLLTGLLMISSMTTAQSPEAKTALEQGVCAFKNKDYRLAETEFEKALQKEPANKLLLLFAARAIDFQVAAKDGSAGNIAKARSAIDAYSKLLAADPANAEAVSSIVRLYTQIDADSLGDIATNEATPKQVRTAIYVKLAAAGNTCANDITDANKTEVARAYKYHMPKDPKDLAKAKACVSDGMKFIDKALALDTMSESAWSYKTSLLMLSSHLAEMQQQTAEKAALDKQALAAKAEFRKLADAAREVQANADREEQDRSKKDRPTNLDNVLSTAKFLASGGVTKKVEIDESSTDSRDMQLLELAAASDKVRQPTPDPPEPPIVWKAFTPPDGTFSVQLPATFDVGSKFYFAKGEGISFFFVYTDISTDHPPATDEQIMGAIASALADGICSFSLMAHASCDIRFSKKTTLGTHPGLEYTISEDDCIKVLPGVLRVYKTLNRVYALAAIGAEQTDQRIAKFLTSFAIKK
jgi:tetratricopeptide (TPR) repeat protein